MKSRFLYLLGLILLLLALVPFLRSRPESISWHTDYGQAMEEAGTSEKAVLAFLYTDWCSFCRKMDAETFSDPDVITQMKNKYVWLRLNAEEDASGVAMRDRFSVNGFPTTLILDSEGEELERIPGFVPPSDFATRVGNLLDSESSLGSLKAQAHAEQENPERQYALGTAYLERKQFEKAEAQFLKVAELDPSNEAGKSDASLYYAAEAQFSMGRFQLVLDSLETLQSKFPTSRYSIEAFLMKAEVLLQTGRRDEARNVLTQFLGAHPDHAAGPKVREFLDQETL